MDSLLPLKSTPPLSSAKPPMVNEIGISPLPPPGPQASANIHSGAIPAEHLAHAGDPCGESLALLAAPKSTQPSRSLLDAPVSDRAISYYIKPSYWVRIKAAIFGQTDNRTSAISNSRNIERASPLIKEMASKAGSYIESLVEDQRYLEPITLLFALGHIHEGSKAKEIGHYLAGKNADQLVDECKQYLDSLMLGSPEGKILKEYFTKRAGELIKSIDAFKGNFKNYLRCLTDLNGFQIAISNVELKDMPPEAVKKIIELKEASCMQASSLLQDSSRIIEEAISLQLETIRDEHESLVNTLNANRNIMGNVSNSAWGSIKRNLVSFVSSVLSLVDGVLTGIAYLGIPLLSPVAGLFSLGSKFFLAPGSKSLLSGGIREVRQGFDLSKRLHDFKDADDAELHAITESLHRNQALGSKVFSAISALVNTVALAGSFLLVGATVLSAFGLIGGTLLATLTPIGLGVLFTLLGVSCAF